MLPALTIRMSASSQAHARQVPVPVPTPVPTPCREFITALIHRRMVPRLSPVQCDSLERGIYNATISSATKSGVRRHWENPEFTSLYKSIARTTLVNIDPSAYVHNERLLQRVQAGELNPESIAGMTASELFPEKWADQEEERLKRETALLEGNSDEGSSLFTCNRCQKSRTRYFEMQTRSADEPMTIFIRCLNCGKQWRQ